MTDIQSDIQRHKQRLEQAERENWALKPIPLDQFIFDRQCEELQTMINQHRGRRYGKAP